MNKRDAVISEHFHVTVLQEERPISLSVAIVFPLTPTDRLHHTLDEHGHPTPSLLVTVSPYVHKVLRSYAVASTGRGPLLALTPQHVLRAQPLVAPPRNDPGKHIDRHENSNLFSHATKQRKSRAQTKGSDKVVIDNQLGTRIITTQVCVQDDRVWRLHAWADREHAVSLVF
ncbi:hypothetical protein PsorP6_015138 [Peronosclerospora sorghi]|uniref:Uncharacterized protein n=1 Tax=Peronosclerospora sorghi TaxID=230839 RepID=A0ACC0VS90_9STRA|nr:hypothetical protein PsorP6_015138 [Peronosclerospora sorghi]